VRPIPAGFELGVATSSWQIEGDVAGRGLSTWDEFATRPGAILDGATGEPACDHVRRLEEDLDLLAWLGVDSYRFSISWPRAMDGDRLRPEGIAFYDRLVDGLLARGITPAATLYHWDLPLELERAGGWPERATAEAFAHYAETVTAHLSDRVERWLTLNEPWCTAFLGYCAGYFAPGRTEPGASLAAAYHLMLGHGLAVPRMRAAGAKQVGISLNVIPMVPESDEMAAIAHHLDGVQNRIFLDPLAGRGMPADVVEATRHLTDWSFVRDEDTALMAAPIDWIGENYYTVMRVAPPEVGAGGGESIGQDASMFPGTPPMSFAPRPPLTDMGWEVIPDGLVMACEEIAALVPGVPIWVTENGAAVPEVTRPDGTIDDAWRREYIDAHIDVLLAARENGLDVRGYYAWSLMDNLEWASGWTKRFGLVRVDPGTGTRTPKDSAHWYRDVLAARSR
jgi:beta-glucosidase